jgi:5-methyltetrahydrofolate--homocysteine methyltransferase
MQPEDFVHHMSQFIEKDGVSIVGGCCGTTPDHIRQLAAACSGLLPTKREVTV